MSIETANAARFKKGMTILSPLEGELLEALEEIIESGEIPYSQSCPFVLSAKLIIAHAHGEQS